MGRFRVVGKSLQFGFGPGAVDVNVCCVLVKGNCEFHVCCILYILY